MLINLLIVQIYKRQKMTRNITISSHFKHNMLDL